MENLSKILNETQEIFELAFKTEFCIKEGSIFDLSSLINDNNKGSPNESTKTEKLNQAKTTAL